VVRARPALGIVALASINVALTFGLMVAQRKTGDPIDEKAV
jgi:hypothetical protein